MSHFSSYNITFYPIIPAHTQTFYLEESDEREARALLKNLRIGLESPRPFSVISIS